MIKLSIADLKKSAFVGEPVLKTVSYSQDGQDFEFDVFIRKWSYQSAINDGKAWASDRSIVVAGRILACVLDQEGNQVFDSVEQILGTGDYVKQGALSDALTHALYSAVAEVNEVGKSNSATKTSSSVSLSSTESAEEQSMTQSET